MVGGILLGLGIMLSGLALWAYAGRVLPQIDEALKKAYPWLSGLVSYNDRTRLPKLYAGAERMILPTRVFGVIVFICGAIQLGVAL